MTWARGEGGKRAGRGVEDGLGAMLPALPHSDTEGQEVFFISSTFELYMRLLHLNSAFQVITRVHLSRQEHRTYLI